MRCLKTLSTKQDHEALVCALKYIISLEKIQGRRLSTARIMRLLFLYSMHMSMYTGERQISVRFTWRPYGPYSVEVKRLLNKLRKGQLDCNKKLTGEQLKLLTRLFLAIQNKKWKAKISAVYSD